MTRIGIRDLRKISGEAIGALPGPTPVKSGDRTVGPSIPLETANADHLAAVLARAGSLAQARDSAVDAAALADMGIDPTDWSVEAVRRRGGRIPSATLAVATAVSTGSVPRAGPAQAGCRSLRSEKSVCPET